jgi:hypothetical protein
MCPVPAVSKSNAAEQPSDPAPQSIVQLLTELVEQNRELCKRQGVLERQLEASGKQHAELTRAVGTLKHCVEQMCVSHQTQMEELRIWHQTQLQAVAVEHQQRAHHNSRCQEDQSKLTNSHEIM